MEALFQRPARLQAMSEFDRRAALEVMLASTAGLLGAASAVGCKPHQPEPDREQRKANIAIGEAHPINKQDAIALEERP